MAWTQIYGVSIGDGSPTPKHDNENMRLSDHQTPAECLQWVRRVKKEMQKELAENFTLRQDPEHRRVWEEINAYEQCCLWQFYRDRG